MIRIKSISVEFPKGELHTFEKGQPDPLLGINFIVKRLITTDTHIMVESVDKKSDERFNIIKSHCFVNVPFVIFNEHPLEWKEDS